jgi:predicted AlkP superfamily pyrophosphatase or phosphodiesterase
MEYNKHSLDTICSALTYAMGVDAPEKAQEKNPDLSGYVDSALGGEKADRIFMYNPDAIAQWVYEKYAHLMDEAIDYTDIKVPLCTVMPSVTPVCFATMYTGTQPEVHGIRRYEKPVLTVDTLFDALIRAGKKCAIIADKNASMAHIFNERAMDYFVYDTTEEINAKASELIINDEYDFIAVYNGNYDALMHRWGPESIESLAELRSNSYAFGEFTMLIRKYWKNHNTLVGFAMDHGCHEIDGGCGSHGLDMEEDLNIVHLYKAYPKEK